MVFRPICMLGDLLVCVCQRVSKSLVRVTKYVSLVVKCLVANDYLLNLCSYLNCDISMAVMADIFTGFVKARQN